MNRTWLAVAVALVAANAVAAVQYEFRQVTQSEVESIPSSEFTGRATIDGLRSRVDFLSGDAYPAGSYVISKDGARTLTFIDPQRKTYVDFDTAAAAQAIGSSKITVENKKAETVKLDDHPVIAGQPTDHYRVTISYDMTLQLGIIPVRQSVKTVIDRWTTDAFGVVGASMLNGNDGAKTGNAQIDDLIASETNKLAGVPLRELMQITTINAANAPADSKLQVSRVRTQSRETVVSSIKQVPASPILFIVPPSYHKADPLKDDNDQSPVHVLSMEPAS